MDPGRLGRARRLRREQTTPEAVLWSRLRNRRLGGLKFRRQQVIGPYTVDFFCPEAGLVVEVDGSIHLRTRAADAARDRWLRCQGYEVIRVPVPMLSKRLGDVLSTILRVANGS